MWKQKKTRLRKELEKLNKLVAAGEGKLKNPRFVDGAPAQVVEGARRQLAETTQKARRDSADIRELVDIQLLWIGFIRSHRNLMDEFLLKSPDVLVGAL